MVKLKIKNSPDSWARPEELPRKRLSFFQQQCKFFGWVEFVILTFSTLPKLGLF
jgi:hypothetical protein